MMKIGKKQRFFQALLMVFCTLIASSAGWSRQPLAEDAATGQGVLKPVSIQASADEDHLSPGHFQLLVMDFADEYISAIGDAIDGYVASEPDAAKRVAAQYWKIRYTSAAMSIAASRDPRSNLLDMVVFISAGKWAVSNYWIPKVFGEKAAPLAAVYQQMDRKISAIAGEILSTKQQEDLHQLILNWEHSNPRIHEVDNVRLRNLDGVHLQTFDDGRSAWGILGSVRKIMRRMDQSLLYGERLMFCLERTPQVLAFQSDLTIAQVGEAFPLAAMRPETIASSLQQGIDHNETNLTALLPQLGATLESANSLAKSLDKGVQTLGNAGATMSDPVAALKDANQALAHLDASISGINQLMEKNALGSWKAEDLNRQIADQANRLMDEAFRRIMLLLGAFFGGIVVLLLLAKILFFRKTTVN